VATRSGAATLDQRSFYAVDPARELDEQVLATTWVVDGTDRVAELRWYPHTGELAVVDRGQFEVWAVERDEQRLAALLSDHSGMDGGCLSWLRRRLDESRRAAR
jgi:hypothetical protein